MGLARGSVRGSALCWVFWNDVVVVAVELGLSLFIAMEFSN